VTAQEPADSPRHWCYGCGDLNPEGLRIDFQTEGRRVLGRFLARDVHQGYPGLAHGGIAAAALDEAMGWAMYAAGAWAVTARINVKYRRPILLGERLSVTAEIMRERTRTLEAEAVILADDGTILAEAKGLFFRVSPDKAAELNAFSLPAATAGDGEVQ